MKDCRGEECWGAGWACIHTQAKGRAGLMAAERMKRRAEATPGVCGRYSGLVTHNHKGCV